MRLYHLLLAVSLVSCVAGSAARDDIFVNPSRYLGRQVDLCGYMIDSANIVEAEDRDDAARRGGFSIADKGPLNLLHRGPICVVGEIIYIGCQTGDVVCTDAFFDYGIRILAIEDARARP